jgi:hypothetical protein
LENRCDGTCGSGDYRVKLTYTLRDGRTVVRSYYICKNDETRRLFANVDVAIELPNEGETDQVPQTGDVSLVICTLDGLEYRYRTEGKIRSILALHQWILDEGCDGNCGNDHIPVKITYTFNTGFSTIRGYFLCDCPAVESLIANITGETK